MRKLFSTLCTVMLCFSCAAQQKVSMEQNGNNVKVMLDGKVFTEYVHGEQKPYLYPVIGPNGINMTRNFPMKDNVKEEKKDHPWHSSVYYTHGDVNGIDFWNDKSSDQKEAKIILDKIEKVENVSPTEGRIIATHKWVAKGKTQLSDRTEISFSGDADKRIIDYTVTLIATDGDVKLGDTKEGCMAVRMHYKLRVKDMGATVINSEGNSGKSVWGKKAKWISYYNKIGEGVAGISMMDHPDNLRYPTPWHARDYGLCAANAFGLKYFTGNKKNTGDLVIKNGESLTFKHRLVFHNGSPEDIKVNDLHTEWIKK
ncbi:MAG: PmoA family protein [Lentisphaeraceae bacterium]|nr:PmoA family protein [Lentisphaeraceae bacterium]